MFNSKCIINCNLVINLECLFLNENEITSMKPCQKLGKLKELHLNFNLIEKIEGIENLTNLETFWISENKISKLENLPKSLKNLNVASNFIEKIDNDFLMLENLEEINFANNFFINLQDILIISKLKNLRKLFYQDISYGENPIYLMNNYRVIIFLSLFIITDFHHSLHTST